jgi:plastocyanin
VLPLIAGLAVLLGLSVLFSACEDGMWDMGDMHSEMHGRMHGGPGGAPQTPVVSNASEVTVDISGFDFLPRDLTIAAGTSVTWVNHDLAPHDATDVDGGWATAMLTPGESDTLTFDSAGAYEYLCSIHPAMTATLTVT